MKKSTLILLLFFSIQNTAASNDRSEILQTMKDFKQWDLYGGTSKDAEKFFGPKVQFQAVQDGNLTSSMPDLESKGEGENSYKTHVLDLNVYDDLATVTVLKRYNPAGPVEYPYVKTFILHKLKQGWRITNVFWGKPTPGK